MKTNKLLCLILTFMMLFTFTPAFADADTDAVDAVLAKAADGTLVGEITTTKTLPTEVDGVALSWSLEENDLAILEENIITVKAVSLTEDLSLPLTVTAAKGTVTKSGSALAKVTVDKGGMPVAPTDPADERYYIYEDFSDTTLATGLSYVTTQHGTTVIDNRTTGIDTTNGTLYFNTKNTSSSTTGGVRVKFGKSFTGSTYDNTVFEVKFAVPANTFSSYINFDSTESSTSCSASYRVIKNELNSNGYTYYNGSAQTVIEKPAKLTYTNKYVVDFTNSRYDLYVDDTLIISDAAFSNNAAIKSFFLGMANKSNDATNGNTWSIDYIKVYKTGWEDPVSVDAPPAKTYDKTLTLDTNDGAITWESSDPSIIAINGATATITRPAIDTDVTLTASKVVGGIKNFKTFTVKVFGNMVPSQIGENIFFEDFSGEDGTKMISGGTFNLSTLTSAEIVGGRLVLTGETGKRGQFFFNSAENAVATEGRVAYQFDVEVANNKKVAIRLGTGTSGREDLRFTPGGNINSTSGSGFYMNGTYPSVSLTTPSEMTLTVVVDYAARIFNLYMNGIEIGRNISDGPYAIKNIDFMCDGGANTIYVDNIKVYNVGLNAFDKVDADTTAIEAAGIAGVNTLVDGLVESEFATTAAANGSTIRYSSAKGYVKADGTLNRPELTDTDTVTATVYCGTYEKSIVFADVEIAGKLVVKEMSAQSGVDEEKNYTAVFPAYTLDESTKTVTMIVAYYNADGTRLLDVDFQEKTINPKSNEDTNYITGTVKITGNEAEPNVKAFIWKNTSSISPLPLVK